MNSKFFRVVAHILLWGIAIGAIVRGRESDIQHQTLLEVLHRMEIKADNYAGYGEGSPRRNPVANQEREFVL